MNITTTTTNNPTADDRPADDTRPADPSIEARLARIEHALDMIGAVIMELSATVKPLRRAIETVQARRTGSR